MVDTKLTLVSPSAAGMFTGNINANSVDVAGSRWDKNVRIHQLTN